MKPELQNLLFEKYPLIFANRQNKSSPMQWGISCGDGWFNIIDSICELLQMATNNRGHEQVVADQVKEKFGVLVFSARRASDYHRALIDMSCAMSERTCELCGRPGKLFTTGWYKTRCEDHEGVRRPNSLTQDIEND